MALPPVRDYELIKRCAITCVNEAPFYDRVCNADKITVVWMETRILGKLFRVDPDLYKQLTPAICEDVAYYLLDYYHEMYKDKYSSGVISALESGRSRQVFAPDVASYSGSDWQHHNPMTGDYTCDEPTKETYEEYEKMAKVFETKHFVNGTDMNLVSTEDLIVTIAQLEKRITSLKKVKVKSKAITQQIKQCKADITNIVKHMDKRV